MALFLKILYSIRLKERTVLAVLLSAFFFCETKNPPQAH
jgi:hypothetical protein